MWLGLISTLISTRINYYSQLMEGFLGLDREILLYSHTHTNTRITFQINRSRCTEITNHGRERKEHESAAVFVAGSRSKFNRSCESVTCSWMRRGGLLCRCTDPLLRTYDFVSHINLFFICTHCPRIFLFLFSAESEYVDSIELCRRTHESLLLLLLGL